jgi:hypothetical protein
VARYLGRGLRLRWAVALPDQQFGTAGIPRVAVAVGKAGYVYLLDRDDLGGIGMGPGGSDQVLQRLGPYGGVWSRPGVWPGDGGYVYIPTASGGSTASESSGNLRVYRYGTTSTGRPALALAGTSEDAFGSGAPVITSNGTASGSGLVWTVWAPSGSGENAQLRAYDPVPVEGKPVLRKSWPIGTASKFSMPGVAGNRVFVGTRDGKVRAFGSPVNTPLSTSGISFPPTTVGETNTQTLTLAANENVTVSACGAAPGSSTLTTAPACTRSASTAPEPATVRPASR